MPVFGATTAKYKPPKDTTEIWDEFRGGLNTLFPQTEIQRNELSQMDNLMLIGQGVPKKRSGTNDYFLTYSSVATNTMLVRGLKSVKFASGASGVLELLAVSDAGYLVKQNNASYSIIPGFSYSSGYNAELVQLNNNVYVANGQNIFTRYNGVTITSFTSLTLPASLTATLWSGATGTHTFNWLITAANDIGEVNATAVASLSGLPQSLQSASVRIAWSPASPSSIVTRYNIYGREIGFATFLAGTDGTTNQFIDDGSLQPSLIALPPTFNTTGGPVFKYMITSKDKIFGGNVSGAPSRVMWSGGGAFTDKFHYSVGGGFVDISPSDGDEIMGLFDFQDSVIVFKRKSIWQLTLGVSGSIVIPKVVLITRAIGTAAPRTIKQVENDLFYLSDRGAFALGNEPNITALVLRTAEISVKVRPLFKSLNAAQIQQACAIYQDNKYRISFPAPGSSVNNREIWYDRERLAWVGPMTYPATANVYELFRDSANTEHVLWGDSGDNFVSEYSDSYSTDKGIAIPTVLLTKKEAFEDPFLFKRIKEVFTNWRNIRGSLSVAIFVEDRTGNVVTSTSFSITPTTTGVGWGFDKWGTQKWGITGGAGSQAASADLVRWASLLKIARNIQVQVTTTGATDTYELLALKYRYHMVGPAYIPQGWKVN